MIDSENGLVHEFRKEASYQKDNLSIWSETWMRRVLTILKRSTT